MLRMFIVLFYLSQNCLCFLPWFVKPFHIVHMSSPFSVNSVLTALCRPPFPFFVTNAWYTYCLSAIRLQCLGHFPYRSAFGAYNISSHMFFGNFNFLVSLNSFYSLLCMYCNLLSISSVISLELFTLTAPNCALHFFWISSNTSCSSCQVYA